MTIAELKGTIRKEIKERIKGLPTAYCMEADLDIQQQVLDLPQWKDAKTVMGFISAFGEPDTWPLLMAAWKAGKRVGVPRCLADGIMKVYQIDSKEDLETGAYGIREPKQTCPEIPGEEIDFALIPCVTCDEAGNRLGHGKGYYDRYLKAYSKNMFTCMVCRRALMVESVPMDSHDKKADMWIADRRACIDSLEEVRKDD
ncbi:MAG: 5-formyltetrahydrofolate cyclo-ligase [Firmicutes bacterium]|nr:5-formyltetrahydrofolate cyclo-ligase [Bacillota bacterium]